MFNLKKIAGLLILAGLFILLPVAWVVYWITMGASIVLLACGRLEQLATRWMRK